MKVLVVEDDLELRSVLSRGLREEGFDVHTVGTGGEVLPRVAADPPDVLDIGLPDADGRDVCQALRARGIQTPVLFLTARDALVDRIAGFDAGGDDYVAKPFALAEVIARIHALLFEEIAKFYCRGGAPPSPRTIVRYIRSTICFWAGVSGPLSFRPMALRERW